MNLNPYFTEQELYRQIVDSLRLGLLISPLGEPPALREQIAQSSGDGFETVPISRIFERRNVVEDHLPVLIVCAPEAKRLPLVHRQTWCLCLWRKTAHAIA